MSAGDINGLLDEGVAPGCYSDFVFSFASFSLMNARMSSAIGFPNTS